MSWLSIANIFIVDDDQSVLRLLKLLFQGMGFQVIGTAANGQIAIDKFRAFPKKPDILIIDYRMPIKNGIDTIIEILKINHHSKIIFTTADIRVKEQALRAGAYYVLFKPFKFEVLLKSIRDALK